MVEQHRGGKGVKRDMWYYWREWDHYSRSNPRWNRKQHSIASIDVKCLIKIKMKWPYVIDLCVGSTGCEGANCALKKKPGVLKRIPRVAYGSQDKQKICDSAAFSSQRRLFRRWARQASFVETPQRPPARSCIGQSLRKSQPGGEFLLLGWVT